MQSEIKYVGSSSSKIYIDDPKLSSTVLIYKSNIDISWYNLHSSCEINYSFLEEYKSLYFFKVDYGENSLCKNGNIVLENAGAKIISSLTRLHIRDRVDDLETFIDYNTADLQDFLQDLEETMQKYAIYKNYSQKSIAKNYSFLKGQRKYEQALYRKEILDYILAGRKHKYISPVPGKHISEKYSKVPNAPRPYRDNYTDGIHHGWDIDGGYGDQVVALDDGIIVRVVSDFDKSDFSRIQYGDNLSDTQKLQNLDILRGKQVWLKTLKGEVVFYSHLDTVIHDLSTGDVVQKWDKIGTTGVTGVPQDGYDDYHLHFAIMENPYTIEKAWLYNIWDYMSWDWLTRGMDHEEVINAQRNIFE